MHEYNAHLLEIALIPLRQARSQEAQRALIHSQLTGVLLPPPSPAHFTQRGIVPAKSKPFAVPRVIESIFL
jgi:hypothetical protein